MYPTTSWSGYVCGYPSRKLYYSVPAGGRWGGSKGSRRPRERAILTLFLCDHGLLGGMNTPPW